jgi:hypothetical protein
VNASGSVNGVRTAAAVTGAQLRALHLKLSNIRLIIPPKAVGLSSSCLRRITDAARGMTVTLSLQNGAVLIPVNAANIRQIRTGFDFEPTAYAPQIRAIRQKYEIDIISAFSTKQTGGWGASARFSIPLSDLGFEAQNGTTLTALIYDPATGALVKTPVTITGGHAEFTTKRSGLIVFTFDEV